MNNPVLNSVEVEGLYDQFNIELSLKPGLNVIFGKNGRGKTTLLHILANTLELDFHRFHFLHFKTIKLTTVGGATLMIHKIPGEPLIKLVLNGLPVGTPSPTGPELAPAERQMLRDSFGARPIYLPAFRSIIERVRSDTVPTYTQTGREAELERIREHEREAEREAHARRATPYGRYRDLVASNARKTLQCREWFGQFVPMIRYPAITEVAERLMEEFREAQLDLGYKDSRMLSEMFVDVFRALLSEEVVPTDWEVETLIRRVSQSLSAKKDQYDQDSSMDRLGASLAEVIEKVKDRGPHQEEAAERRVLKLYAQMLERRNEERKQVFSRFRSFEDAVNRFLEGKALRVRDDPERAFRRDVPGRRELSGVFIETARYELLPSVNTKVAARGSALDLQAETSAELSKADLAASSSVVMRWLCHGHIGEQIVRACAAQLAAELQATNDAISNVETGRRQEKLLHDADAMSAWPDAEIEPIGDLMLWAS